MDMMLNFDRLIDDNSLKEEYRNHLLKILSQTKHLDDNGKLLACKMAPAEIFSLLHFKSSSINNTPLSWMESHVMNELDKSAFENSLIFDNIKKSLILCIFMSSSQWGYEPSVFYKIKDDALWKKMVLFDELQDQLLDSDFYVWTKNEPLNKIYEMWINLCLN